MRSILSTLFLATILEVGIAHSQETAKPATASTTDPNTVLDRLVGTWKQSFVNHKAEWNERETRSTGDYTSKRILNDRYLQQITTNSDGSQNMHIYSYDPSTKRFWYWHFPSEGTPTLGQGTWDESKQTLTWKIDLGEELAGTSVVRWIGHGLTEWEVKVVDPKGTLLLHMEGKDTRLKESE